MKRMIRTLALILTVIICTNSQAQVFQTISSQKLPVKPSVIEYEHTSDFKYFIVSSKTDMMMLDGTNGKVLWQINFLKEFNNEKFSNQYWNKHANVILLFDNDSKKGDIAEKYFIDGKTGKLLWKSNQYVSDYGKYELSQGFTNFYDEETQGVLLPTKEHIEMVNVLNGNVLWSKKFDLTGKARNFDCYQMEYYNLVRVVLDKDNEMFLKTSDGTEVNDIDPYFSKKKFLADRKRTTMLDIPEKNMYVIMRGKESVFLNAVGILTGAGTGFQAWKMSFEAYDKKTDKLIWAKEHKIAQAYDWITYQPYLKMFYAKGKLFIEHEPNLKSNSGLTVLNIDNGEKLWECYYTTTEMKGAVSVTLTPFPAPDPIIEGDNVYVVDKLKNKVVCYNLNDGKMIWESEKFPDAQKIPVIMSVGDKIIMVHGGSAKKISKSQRTLSQGEYCRSYVNNNKRVICSGNQQYTYKYEFNSNDKYGIIVYNAKTGKEEWTSKKISKAAKDKFSYIASAQYINGKLYCATDKNFFILNPDDGSVVTSVPVSKQKVGNIWGMTYFAEKDKIVLTCVSGIIKIDAKTGQIDGSIKVPTVQGPVVSEIMGGDDYYDDFAVFTKGDVKKQEFKNFASIDLDAMKVRGIETAELLFFDNPHFSDGAELFFRANGANVTFYKVK